MTEAGAQGSSPLQPYRRLSQQALRILWSVCDRLVVGAEESSREIADRIVAEVPEYERFGEDDSRAGFVTAVRALVDFFPELARVGRRISAAERDDAATIGEQRAREGVSFGAITSALQCGFEVARGKIFLAFWGLSRSDQEPVALEALVAALDAYQRDVIEAFREGMGRVEVEDQRDRNRARDAFLSTILVDDSPDPEVVTSQATELDAQLAFPLQVVLVVDRLWPSASGDGAGDPFPDRASALARCLPRPVLGPVAIEHPDVGSPVRCVLVPDLTSPRERQAQEALLSACDELDLLALHATTATLFGLSRTTTRLVTASSVLDRLVPVVGRVTTPEALYGHRVADGLSLVEQDHELSTLAAPVMTDASMAESHIATIRAMLNNQLRKAAAARELGVGPDTVTDRLEKISELTGLSVSDRETWRRWDLVLCLLDLYASVLPEPGAEFWPDRDHGPSLASLVIRSSRA